jgi:hypothetical protein
VRTPARCDVDDNVGPGLDLFEEGHEQGRILRWATVLWVAGMQVHDRGACLSGSDGGIGDFIRRHRQMGRHAGGVNGAGHGATDDDLAILAHGFSKAFGIDIPRLLRGISIPNMSA